MPTYSLIAHPDYPPHTMRGGVEVALERDRNDLLLTFWVVGAERMVLPAWSTPSRADELWRTTCFELFLRFDDNERYIEFNFSPSTRWAAYAFDGYRESMTDLPLATEPRVTPTGSGIRVACDLTGLPHGELAMALSAVIEAQDGTKAYWALAHAPGPPDFHNPACFIARLPAPDAA